MNAEFDGDIKIYGKKPVSDISDFDIIVENIDFNRSNGNEEKAEQLGIVFAELKPTDECLKIEFPKAVTTASVLYQSRVFISFLCGKAAKNQINNSLLADTVRNAMFEHLKKTEQGYYKNIADGAAFSFYRVALQKGGNPEENAGLEFAKLCGEAKNPALIELGKAVYNNTNKYASALIEKADFKL